MSKLTYERAKQLYTPYDEGQMRHLCALRDVEIDRLRAENAKLRELVNGLTWCCENYGCDNRCQLYDKSEPDHCCEQRLKRELGIEVPS